MSTRKAEVDSVLEALNRVFPWKVAREDAESVTRELVFAGSLAPSPASGAIDVERLAKAIEQRRTGLPFEEPLLVSDLEEAAGIAAEYNRLAASQPTPGTHEIERDALRTTILAAIENIAHGRTGAAVAGLRAARDRYGFRVALVTPPETTA